MQLTVPFIPIVSYVSTIILLIVLHSSRKKNCFEHCPGLITTAAPNFEISEFPQRQNVALKVRGNLECCAYFLM